MEKTKNRNKKLVWAHVQAKISQNMMRVERKACFQVAKKFFGANLATTDQKKSPKCPKYRCIFAKNIQVSMG